MSYIRHRHLSEHEYAPFAGVKKRFGFIPNVLQAQTDRKDLIEAQMELNGAVIGGETFLERRQKEYIFLAVSARNLSTYCVTAHCEIVRMLKLDGPEPEQIAIDHNSASIPLRDKALINFAVKLNNSPHDLLQADVDALRTFGFTDAQIQEAILITGLACCANTIAFGLGTAPDFHNERTDFSRR